jgi:serine/threonine-protein kinase MRCK
VRPRALLIGPVASTQVCVCIRRQVSRSSMPSCLHRHPCRRRHRAMVVYLSRGRVLSMDACDRRSFLARAHTHAHSLSSSMSTPVSTSPLARAVELAELVLAPATRSIGGELIESANASAATDVFSAEATDLSRTNGEALLDAIVALHDECANSAGIRRDKKVSMFATRFRRVVNRIKELRIARSDFEILKTIGRGAFGEVHVVRGRYDSKIYAMKTLNKWDMLKRQETACFREERDLLVAVRSRWVVELQFAFQDDSFLYLVMEYYNGGDLLTMMSKNGDRLSEDACRFYLVEVALAIDAVHSCGFIHRDIKPDNVLLDATGHVRLADFGSCCRVGPSGRVRSIVAVGTPDYISPEILLSIEGKGEYGKECDWWSLGILMYELIFGETPFYSESLVGTYSKIMDHVNQLSFDVSDDNGNPVPISDDAKALITGLCTDAAQRVGRNGLADLKAHPFLAAMDWEHIADQKPPFVPSVKSELDTSNFDTDDLAAPPPHLDRPKPPPGGGFTGDHLPFIGFSFTRGSSLSDGSAVAASTATTAPEKGSSGKRVAELEELLAVKMAELNEARELAALSVRSAIERASQQESKLKQDVAEAEERVRSAEEDRDHIMRQLDESLARIVALEKETEALRAKEARLRQELSDSRTQQDASEETAKLLAQLAERETAVAASEEELAKQRFAAEAAERRAKSLDDEVVRLRAAADDARRQAQEAAQESSRLLQEQQDAWQAERTKLVDERRALETQLLKAGSEYAQQLEHLRSEKETEHQQLIEARRKAQDFELEISKLNQQLAAVSPEAISNAQAEAASLRKGYRQELQAMQQDLDNALSAKSDLENKMQESVARADNAERESQRLAARVAELEQKLTAAVEKTEQLDRDKMDLEQTLDMLNVEYESMKAIAAEASRAAAEAAAAAASVPTINVARFSTASTSDGADVSSNHDAATAPSETVASTEETAAHVTANASAGEPPAGVAEVSSTSVSSTATEASAPEPTEVQGVEAVPAKTVATSDPVIEQAAAPTATTTTTNDAPAAVEPSAATAPKAGVVESTNADAENAEQVAAAAAAAAEAAATAKAAAAKAAAAAAAAAAAVASPNKGVAAQVSPMNKVGSPARPAVMPVRPRSRPQADAVVADRAETLLKTAGLKPFGLGRIIDGWLRLPKPGGVRKGWRRHWVVLYESQLCVFGPEGERGETEVQQVMNLAHPSFAMQQVKQTELIHANASDIPRIFQLELAEGSHEETMYLLAESEDEKALWMKTIADVHQAVTRILATSPSAFLFHTLFDTETSPAPFRPLLKGLTCFERCGPFVLIGTEDGLYAYTIMAHPPNAIPGQLRRIGEAKRIVQLQVVPEQRLVVCLMGKSHYVRLYTFDTIFLEREGEFTLEETRGATQFAVGEIAGTAGLAVMVKRRVLVYSLGTKEMLHEVAISDNFKQISFLKDSLCSAANGKFHFVPFKGSGVLGCLCGDPRADVCVCLSMTVSCRVFA